MKNQPPETSRKRSFGMRPAIAVEAFIIVLMVCLLLFGKFGTWLLNALKNLMGQ
jgi:hypothetical protein